MLSVARDFSRRPVPLFAAASPASVHAFALPTPALHIQQNTRRSLALKAPLLELRAGHQCFTALPLRCELRMYAQCGVYVSLAVAGGGLGALSALK